MCFTLQWVHVVIVMSGLTTKNPFAVCLLKCMHNKQVVDKWTNTHMKRITRQRKYCQQTCNNQCPGRDQASSIGLYMRRKARVRAGRKAIKREGTVQVGNNGSVRIQ